MQKYLLIMRHQNIQPEDMLTAYHTGEYPGEYLWGYGQLCDMHGQERVGIIYTGGSGSNHLFSRRVSSLSARLFGDMKVLPSLALQLWKQRREIEAVFVTANSAIMTTVLLKVLGCGFRVYPLLLGWLDVNFSQMNRLKRRIWISLLRHVDSIMALGVEESHALRQLGLDNVQHLPFGVDTEFWKPVSVTEKNYIFSIGADPNRDFATLLSANLDIPTIICAPSERFNHLILPNYVTVVKGSYLDVRNWFHEAKLVVIPIVDAIRPSGQVCILEAMATGKAVITTRTRGSWTDKLIDGENCILVPPHDPDALRDAIQRVYTDAHLLEMLGKNARKTVLAHFTTRHYTAAVVKITRIKA